MPKISDEQRQARRDQILAAVWRCFLRNGVHGTSMEDIIEESELSAGAVYLYYKSKDELILAAISTYMGQLGGLLMPVLAGGGQLSPLEFVQGIISVIHTHTKRVGIDLNPVILMGWSEAQTNKRVGALIRGFQAKYRDGLVHVVRHWQSRRFIGSSADPEIIAKALMSFFLGSIAQQAILGDADPEVLTRGFEELWLLQPKSAKSPRLRSSK